MSRPCVHADAIHPVPPPGSGCETCLEIGDTWVHLRQCLTCGRTLCCDDSPNRHTSRHCRAEGHPVPLFGIKGACEAALEKSGMQYVICSSKWL